MSLLKRTKPISYLNASADKIAQELKEDEEHYVTNQNDETTMVEHSVTKYEQPQETLVMLKMLAHSEYDIARGNIISANDAIAKIKKQHSL